jgi:hypothetical protein
MDILPKEIINPINNFLQLPETYIIEEKFVLKQ